MRRCAYSSKGSSYNSITYSKILYGVFTATGNQILGPSIVALVGVILDPKPHPNPTTIPGSAKMKRSRDAEDEDDSSGYGEQVAMVPIYKILNLDTEESNPESNAIQCSLPGHAKGMSFVDYHDYERHYVQAHTNRCVECSRNFPTSHILGLHIQEFHDALAEMQREQGAYTVSVSAISVVLAFNGPGALC